MSDTPFHQTRMGSVFYERTMPELVKQLARLNEHLGKIARTTSVDDLVEATTHLIAAVERVLDTEIVPGSPATRSAFAELRTCAQAARDAVDAVKET